MAAINTKVVRRSNALTDYPYGKDFRYEEAVMSGKGIKGRLKAIMIDKRLPEPGEGPNKAAREAGFYNLKFFNILEDDSIVVGKVTGDMDPGYGSTSKMLAESAICLAKDDIPNLGGVLTPSVAMGDALLKRLQENAGLSFSFNGK